MTGSQAVGQVKVVTSSFLKPGLKGIFVTSRGNPQVLERDFRSQRDKLPRVTAEPTDDEALHPLLAARGIRDFESGVGAVKSHFNRMRKWCSGAMKAPHNISPFSLGLLAMLTKAQAFHDGALMMIEDDNPFASDALTRAYAENAAALIWLESHPEDSARFALSNEGLKPVSVGRMINEAAKRATGFKRLYASLSESAHPSSSTFPNTWRATGEDRVITWGSVPSFKSDERRLWSCLWLMEITDMHGDVWPRLYATASPSSEL